MKKIELIQKLKQLEGITQDERAYLINLVNTKKKYGLVWEDKPEEVEEQLRENLPVLKEVKDKAIVNGKNFPNHILIEGDNLQALTVLTFTHEEKIDVIYIDPPYNTGNKSWRYNNDYVEKDDNYLHSKWLSFMEKRLKIAKKLLKKTGVLVCTIDDNENAALELLLKELFPASEIVGVVIIHNPAGVQGKNFSYTHEFAYFVYPKNGKFIGQTERDKDLVSPLRDWGGTSARKLAKTCFYPIIVKDGKIIGFGEICKEDFHPKSSNVIQEDGSIFIYPIDQNGIERKWVYSKTSAEKNIHQLTVKKLKGELVIIRKKNLFTYRTVWDDKKYYANIYGSKLLNGIISTDFPFPKSLYAVKDCIKAIIHDKSSAIILDFFAGSGTTGQAVIELNEEDAGQRQFILCTNNENNICEEVTYERNKRIIQGYNFNGKISKDIFKKSISLDDLKNSSKLLDYIEKNVKEQENNFDRINLTLDAGELLVTGIKQISDFKPGLNKNNFRYYKCDCISRTPSLKNKRELTKLATELLCIKENVYSEQKIIGEYKLNATYTRWFQEEDLYLLIIYDEDVIEQIVDIIKSVIKKAKGKKLHFKVYVFSNGQYPYTEEFEEVLEHITLCALPDAIYKAYQNVLPKRKRMAIPELEEQTTEEVEAALEDEIIKDLFNQD